MAKQENRGYGQFNIWGGGLRGRGHVQGPPPPHSSMPSDATPLRRHAEQGTCSTGCSPMQTLVISLHSSGRLQPFALLRRIVLPRVRTNRDSAVLWVLSREQPRVAYLSMGKIFTLLNAFIL